MSKDELVFGTPAAYRFLVGVFGEMFAAIHTLRSFVKRAERSVPPFSGGDIPWYHKDGEDCRTRKAYCKRELINWFVSGFSSAQMRAEAQARAQQAQL